MVVAASFVPEEAPGPVAATLLGVAPMPRVLIVGDGVAAEVAEATRELAPTVGLAETLAGVRQEEWDAIVTATTPVAKTNDYGHPYGADEHPYVVAFVDRGQAGLVDECNPVQIRTGSSSRTDRSEVRLSTGRTCREFVAPTHDDAELNDLVLQDLRPAVGRREQYWFLEPQRDPPQWRPLLVDADGHALAASYRRSATGGETVLVPADVTSPVRWLRWCLRRWRATDPARFGGLLRDWASDERWLSVEELAAAARRDEYRARRTRVLADLETERVALDTAASEAAAGAGAGIRRLLTAQGDDLRHVVQTTLEALGFVVDDMDDVKKAIRSALLEDLRVTDPGAPGWCALVEVRGYARGAQLGDLARIERFTLNFVEETGRRPDVRWYVVNHFRDISPGERPLPLASNPVEVAEFAAHDGAIIDTRTLFGLARTLTGAAPDQLNAAREVLRARSGVWPLDDTAGHSS